MTILSTFAVKEYIGEFYTNYNFAYTGEHFSKSFLEWNKLFVHDLVKAYQTFSTLYRGTVCTIKSVFYRLTNGEILMYITYISFNPIMVTRTLFASHAERIAKGLPSTPPSLIASTKRVSDYSYYGDGGLYGRHIVDIVKKKRSSGRKPQFNYYDRSTRAIMFDYDFYSAFPFDGIEAYAWATDGHKYKLPQMLFIESKKNNIDSIITEVLNRYLGRELLRT